MKTVEGSAEDRAGKRKKRIFLGLGCLAAAAALLLSTRQSPAAVVETDTVRFCHIEDAVPASGKIHPVVEVKISPDVSGEIVELNYKEGDQVNQGDVILRIRPDLYQSQLEQAEAMLSSLEADLRRRETEQQQAEIKLERSRHLFEKKVISLAELESAISEERVMEEMVNAARFSVSNGEAQLREMEENLRKTTVTAPMAGTISRMYVEKGERVVGTSQMAGTEMLRIADFSCMEAIVDVNESDVVRMQLGDRAEVRVDAYPRLKFEGKVTQIANSAKNIGTSFEQVTNFEVRIEILPESIAGQKGESPCTLLPGMSATVSISLDSDGECLAVPVQSVFSRDRSAYVWVIDKDGTARERKIVTGIQDFERIEVLSGIREGEIVVRGPLSAIERTLSDGMKTETKTD